ncbi:MAG: diguanylate cyclase [Vampirovibrionales bacterium]|nr:diguanylate cyclase [Vampirovibrionales bacterium]
MATLSSSQPSQEPTNAPKSAKAWWRHLLFNSFWFVATLLIAISLNSVLEQLKFSNFIEALELKTYDLRASFRIGTPKHWADPRTMIVKFDDLTLNLHENDYGTWPWPRKIHAEMIDFMTRAGARMIAYDILFTSPQKGQQESDDALIRAFRDHPNVYFSMNFDNNLELYRQAGQDITSDIMDDVRKLEIPVVNQLNPKNPALKLDKTNFYVNSAMTFNHFRPLLPKLMDVGKRIAIINHGRDPDGISRGNPLFFRMVYQDPEYTQYLPVKEKESEQKGEKALKSQKQYVDQRGRPVTENGILLDAEGNRLGKLKVGYFPYLGLRMTLDMLYPGKNPTVTLTPQGYLSFENHYVPLAKNGNFMVAWYNYNYDQEQARQFWELQQPKISQFEQKLNSDPSFNTPGHKKELAIAHARMERAKGIIENPQLLPAPFPEISASHILMAIDHEKKGTLTERDRQLMAFLKGRVIFVGMTALATYDIKSTPLRQMMPGVILQANIFDNLLQNRFYIHRAHPGIQISIMVALSLLAALCTFRFRSANSGFIATFAITVIYLSITMIAYREYGIWLNVVMPVLVIVVTVILSFMAKYIRRDRDYKQTYILATTDGMTTLYNHRYFKEQMLSYIERCKRANHKFSLVLIDIDHFKKFNDTYGHQAGDEVLRAVARKLKQSVRSVDLVARYGGEEMAVILDRSNEFESLEVAKKLVEAVASEAYPISETVAKHVTISVGVSTYPVHSETVDGLIEFADKGLYRAKENGRNQVGEQFDLVPENPFLAPAMKLFKKAK